MQMMEYTQPEHLLCEIAIKDGTAHDNRLWVYCRLALSLVEFVEVSTMMTHSIDDTYSWHRGTERWMGVFVQNNCKAVARDADEVMRGAWAYLYAYLDWEDGRIMSGYAGTIN